jgi:hypothetical protein
MYSFIRLLFILPNSYMSALSGRRDNNSTENIRNPIRETGTVVICMVQVPGCYILSQVV